MAVVSEPGYSATKLLVRPEHDDIAQLGILEAPCLNVGHCGGLGLIAGEACRQ